MSLHMCVTNGSAAPVFRAVVNSTATTAPVRVLQAKLTVATPPMITATTDAAPQPAAHEIPDVVEIQHKVRRSRVRGLSDRGLQAHARMLHAWRKQGAVHVRAGLRCTSICNLPLLLPRQLAQGTGIWVSCPCSEHCLVDRQSSVCRCCWYSRRFVNPLIIDFQFRRMAPSGRRLCTLARPFTRGLVAS